jgi:hypothetical protein
MVGKKHWYVMYYITYVNKLRSLNLLFSCMFPIERKIVHVGKVYVDLQGFGFTFIDVKDYAVSGKWQKIIVSIFIIAQFSSESMAQW